MNSGSECQFLPLVLLFLFYTNGSLYGPALETLRFDKGCNTQNKTTIINVTEFRTECIDGSNSITMLHFM